MIQSLRSEIREKERLNQDLKNKIKNIPEKYVCFTDILGSRTAHF